MFGSINSKAGELPRGRPRLAAVLRASGDFINVESASKALGVPSADAVKVLARWNSQGWIKRVRRGLYVPVPLDTRTREQVLEDPWVLVPRLFGESYIGGWSAAEHWGLTEQLFRTVYVFTTQTVRTRQQTVEGTPFTLKHINPRLMFGTRPVWRGSTRVLVSTPARTLVDMLDDPATGGGMRHVADCLTAYIEQKSNKLIELIELGDELGNGAVFKRLGFLLELQGADAALIEACRERMTTGLAQLDPALPCPRVITRWRLRVPATWSKRKSA